MSTLLSELEFMQARLAELDDYDFATSSDLRAWQITRFTLELELLKFKASILKTIEDTKC